MTLRSRRLANELDAAIDNPAAYVPAELMTTQPFGLHVTTTKGTTIVEATGDLDLASAPQLRDCLHHLIDTGSRRLVVDLRLVTFIDSSGLGVLVGARRLLERSGPDGDWSMQLICAGGPVLRVLRVTGLHSAFPLHATLSEALGGHPDHSGDQGDHPKPELD